MVDNVYVDCATCICRVTAGESTMQYMQSMQYTSKGNATTVVERQEDAWFVPSGPYALIIDDDDSILSVVMLLLEMEGYAGLGISNSQDVLPFLAQAQTEQLPTVILLDLMMPVVSGYDIATTLAQDERLASIPVIVMTADSRVQRAGEIAGAVGLVKKPFQVQMLLAKLAPYLVASTDTDEL